MIKGFDFNCGKHQWHVSIADTMIMLKVPTPTRPLPLPLTQPQYANWAQIVYAPPIFFAKLALLMQISRIFCVGKRNMTFYFSWGLVVANGITYILVIFIFSFQCTPREKIWNRTMDGWCMDTGTLVLAMGVINLVSDLTILALPIICIWGLQMPLRKKLGIMTIFAIGVLYAHPVSVRFQKLTWHSACAAGVARIYYTDKLIRTEDITFWATVIGMWSVAELVIAILCCCFPTFPRFILYLRGRDPDGKHAWTPGPKKHSSGPTPILGYSPNQSIGSGHSPKKSPWSIIDTQTSSLQDGDDEEMGLPRVPPRDSGVEKVGLGLRGDEGRLESEAREEYCRMSKGAGLEIVRTTQIEARFADVPPAPPGIASLRN